MPCDPPVTHTRRNSTRGTLLRGVAVALLAALLPALARADEVRVAVAANFAAPMKRIAAAFDQDTGHHAVLSFASTGKLYAQIRNGAPFDLLLAADRKTPARLVAEGSAIDGSTRTYAIGRLALWSASAGSVDADGAALLREDTGRIAVADPKLAPYGAAAEQTMKSLGLLERLAPRLVIGENIAQAYQFVASGNAPMGFVALSQVYVDGRIARGSGWIVPDGLYAPIRQDAVLLVRAKDKPAAAALLDYLSGDTARRIIASYGYRTGP